MKKEIELSFKNNFILSAELVTRRLAIMGMSGSGKSNTAGVIVEGLLDIGAQVVILDNDGSWYGVRLTASGKKSSKFNIPIFGGLHGDIPLDPKAGKLIADLIVDRGISLILDVSMFRKGDRHRFATDFAEQLFFRKKEHRSPMMLIIEEAQDFIPQFSGKENARMLGAFEDLTKAGRKYGIGSTIISQRPQAVNKEALNQAEILFVHYLYGKQERKALDEWIVDKGMDENLLDEIPYLEVGQAYIWSPRWLKEIRKIQINLKQTFDASKTPEFGQSAEPKTLDRIELEEIQKSMAEVIQMAEENDPAALKRRISSLQNELQRAQNFQPQQAPPEIIERPVISDDQITLIQEFAQGTHASGENLQTLARDFLDYSSQILSALAAVQAMQSQGNGAKFKTDPRAARSYNPKIVRTVINAPPNPNRDQFLPIGEKKILSACAQYPNGLDRKQLTILTSYKKTSRDAYISRLLTKGYLQIGDSRKVYATQTGIDSLGSDYEPLPTGPALQEYWRSHLPVGERVIFDQAVIAWPDPIRRDSIEGYQKTSRDAYISRLQAKELILTTGPGTIRASDNLFNL